MPQPPRAPVDGVYRAQRARLRSIVLAATAGIWARQHNGDEQQAVRAMLGTVYAGQAQTVALVDAYMAIKAGTTPQGLDAAKYTVESIRGVSAEELYRRPWGALGGQLANGAKFADAMTSAQASLSRLVSTDLQLSQTYSARDWMTNDPSVTGYERVAGGSACTLCEAASQGVYHSADLMPIHENCSCDVVPVTGGDRSPVAADESVRVADEPGFGPRLLADDWAE